MTHPIPRGKIITEAFISDANLTKEEEIVLRTRVAGWSRQRQSRDLRISMTDLDKIINRLKRKYDQAAKYNPLLPPRKFSTQEVWMDEH